MLRNRMVDFVTLVILPFIGLAMLTDAIKDAVRDVWLEMRLEWSARKTYYSVKEATDGK